MPIYEYQCLDCGNKFEQIRSMNDADSPVACTKCNSKNSKRFLSVFCAHSGGKLVAGGSSDCGSCNGGNCSHCNH